MITSYNQSLPLPSQVKAELQSSSKTTTLTGAADAHTLLWEDGGGNEIRFISTPDVLLILIYDNEGEDNFYPEQEMHQLGLVEAPEEVTDLLEVIKDEIIWSWDDTGAIWNTAAFWSLGDQEKWETSYDWEETHDENSIQCMLETIQEEILKK